MFQFLLMDDRPQRTAPDPSHPTRSAHHSTIPRRTTRLFQNSPRQRRQLLWRIQQPNLRMRDPPPNPLNRLHPSRHPILMPTLIVNSHARRRSRRAKPVNAHPHTHLVVTPGVTIRPLDQLLVDPREQARGAVGEPVPERLRLRRLDAAVTPAVLAEPARPRQVASLACRVRRQRVLQRQQRLRAEGRRA